MKPSLQLTFFYKWRNNTQKPISAVLTFRAILNGLKIYDVFNREIFIYLFIKLPFSNPLKTLKSLNSDNGHRKQGLESVVYITDYDFRFSCAQRLRFGSKWADFIFSSINGDKALLLLFVKRVFNFGPRK